MIDTDKYEGHLASEGQTWAWSKWMLKNAETIEQHKATSALLNDAPKLLAEVKRLRRMEKFLIGELTNAKQVMIAAVRDTLDSFSTCPSCDELTETFVDFIPEGLRGEMLLQRQDPESFWYEGGEEE
jgi:hypothetical protein